MFLSRLTGDLKTLVQSTYYGGMADTGGTPDSFFALAVGPKGVYAGGRTRRNDLPATGGGAQSVYRHVDSPGYLTGTAFVVLAAFDLKSFIQASYLGGSGAEGLSALTVDPSGTLVATGYTGSIDFPATAGGAQPSMTSGHGSKAFVTKFRDDLRAFVQSTYLGGSSSDTASAAAVGPDGSIYIAGATNSADFPAVAGGLRCFGGGQQAFIAKLSGDLKRVIQSTFFGGSLTAFNASNQATLLWLTGSGDVVAAGATNTVDFPEVAGGATAAKMDSTPVGFLARITSDLLGGGGTCPTAPASATTLPATNLYENGATLNGTVSANGAPATVFFEYGYSSSLSLDPTRFLVVAGSPLTAGSSNVPVSVTMTGINCGLPVWYRLRADNGFGGVTKGSTLFFIPPCDLSWTGVTSSQNPSLAGQPVTFTATVTLPPGSPAPVWTRNVQFLVDGVNLGGSVPLSGGVAQVTTSALAAGTHVITAVFGGDSSHASSLGTLDGGQVVTSSAPIPVTRLLPVVVDTTTATAHYTTEMALTNATPDPLGVSLLYTASLGTARGSGTVSETLAPGEQKRIPEVLAYLRDKGLAIPSPASDPQQAGTLLVTFQGPKDIDPKLVSVMARTTTASIAPQPVGAAGLAYSGLLPVDSAPTSVALYGLRATAADRSNVAVFSTSSDPVTLRVTVRSGSGDQKSVVTRSAESIPPFGWLQYRSQDILDANTISSGWVTIDKTSSSGSFSAYVVVNDNLTNDGSFIQAVGGAVGGMTLTVPVLAETPAFRSELILANKWFSFPVTMVLNYVESGSPSGGAGGTMTVNLPPTTELIIPEAIDYLRKGGVAIGPKGAASYVGTLRITVVGSTLDGVFAGARTASQSPAGGQFGLFAPAVYAGKEAASAAYLYGLSSDSRNRSNVAALNAGDDSAGPVVLQFQAFDGDAGGVPRGDSVTVTLGPGQWAQPSGFFKNSGIANGWVRVTRLSGSAPWIAYGVVNDGGNAGQRTGDGSYVPMVK